MLYDPKWEMPIKVKPIEPWRRILLNAAIYMERHGWCQGTAKNAAGEVCLLGALIEAGATLLTNYIALGRLEKHLGESAPMWNDDVCRTKDEAVAALRAAAE